MKPDATVDEALKASPYMQMPARLRRENPELVVSQQLDTFGVNARYEAIREVLRGKQLGTIADFGGYSGFFSLSLVDDGLAKIATVYDLNVEAMRAGAAMAKQMKLGERVFFVEQAVSLDFVRSMKPVDSVLCLNLLHHAGSLFDIELVQRDGWEKYANEWLLALRKKCDLAVISLGFKGNSKPVRWDTPRSLRPMRFSQMAEAAGWSVSYEANSEDIHNRGVANARGLQTRSALSAIIRYRLKKLRNMRDRAANKEFIKRQYYHLYILSQSTAPIPNGPGRAYSG